MGVTEPGARRRRVLIEQYAPEIDLRGGGGVEMASLHLARALGVRGIDVDPYVEDDVPALTAPGGPLSRGDVDAVVPLVESPWFTRPDPVASVSRTCRVVRLWHDVTPIAAPWAAVPPCPVHAAGEVAGDAGATCHAAAFPADDGAANIFLNDDAWTRCFPRRHVIPWAVDHLPRRDYRAADGPVLLLAGKIPLADLIRVADACDAAGTATRIVFCNWTRGGERAKRHFAAEGPRPGREVIDFYDLQREHARVFGGLGAALVLSNYHETFNFLAAEAVHFGIPVVALRRSGATLRFAAAALDLDGVVDLIRTGGLPTLAATPRPAWGWRDVAAAYDRLLAPSPDRDDHLPQVSPAALTGSINGRSPCHS